MCSRNAFASAPSRRTDSAILGHQLTRATSSGAALILVLTVVTVLLFSLAGVQRLGYDSYWNVFIARQDVWRDFWAELFEGEHPPLFFFPLRAAASWFGLNAVAYRLVSLLSVIASAWLLATIVWHTTANARLSVVAAAAFGLSFNAVETALEVRGYALSTALTLAACMCYLDWLRRPPGQLSELTSAGFAVALTTAILTEYSAFFFLAAAIAIPFLLAAVSSGWRRRVLHKLRSRPVATGAMFGLPIATAGILFGVHIQWTPEVNHLNQFMFDGTGGTAAAFLARNTLNVAQLILVPWRTESIDPMLLPMSDGFLPATRLLLVGLIVISCVGIAGLRGAAQSGPLLVVAMFTVMVILNAGAGLAGVYPFGGRLRHEFFLFPFAVASFFCVAEAARRRVSLRFSGETLWASALAVGMLISVTSWVSAFRILPGPMFQPLFVRFTAVVGSPDTMLVDQFNFINVFSSYHDWHWTAVHQTHEDLQLWRLTRGGNTAQVCRDRSQWQLDMSAPLTYRQAKRCLDATGSSRVAVFRAQPPGMTPQWDMSQTALIAETLSPESDLKPALIEVDGEHVYALFTWRDR